MVPLGTIMTSRLHGKRMLWVGLAAGVLTGLGMLFLTLLVVAMKHLVEDMLNALW